MGIINQLRNTVMLGLHERSLVAGSEDWLVCRIAANRAIPAEIWTTMDPGSISYAVVAKVCAFAPERGFSKRQQEAIKKLLDKKIDEEGMISRSRVGTAIMRLLEDDKWKACSDLFLLFDRPFLVDEATTVLIRETKDFEYIPADLVDLLPAVVKANNQSLPVYLDPRRTDYVFDAGAVSRHVQYMRWAVETLDNSGALDQHNGLMKDVNQTCSNLMALLGQGMNWLPEKDIKTIFSICRRECLAQVAAQLPELTTSDTTPHQRKL